MGEGSGGISLLGGPEAPFPLNPNPLLLQSKRDSRAQVSDAPRGRFPRRSPLQFGTAPPAALQVYFYTSDLN